ncbi:MAG: signal peptidase I [Cyanobacteria bacterium TGS_CYA1]|nr:signal peptidase I [Cyanobacteria bacterium TGS_CYA1]
MKSLLAVTGTAIAGIVTTFALLITMRFFLEARYIPSEAMLPTLKVNDRLLTEKVTVWKKQFKRGDIITFYPPPIEMGGHELSNAPSAVMGRLTGLPIFPNEVAFIKRVIGLPGDTIEIKSEIGVFVNGKLLEEKYILEKPEYDLKVLGDICGSNTYRQFIQPFSGLEVCNNQIVVPKGQLFVLGDNRNNSEDSHIYGPIDQSRVIGKAFFRVWPKPDVLD